MKLLELEVEGYRSLKHVIWKPGDLNVLIGPNGSGKTNLARVLDFLSVCARGGVPDYVQREGGLWAMAWDGRASSIRVRIVTSVPIPISLFHHVRRTGEEWRSLTYEIETEPPMMSSIGMGLIEREDLKSDKREQSDLEGPQRMLLDRSPKGMSMYEASSRQMVDAGEYLRTEDTLLSAARPPFPLNPDIAEFERALASWTVYQDLWSRVYSSDWSGLIQPSIRIPSVIRTETRISSDGRNLLNFLHTVYQDNREFETQIDDAMRAAFGKDFERITFAQAGDNRIQLRIRWKNLQRDVAAADLSEGTLRFLFLISVLANPSPPPLIVIEEPEIGLHPLMLPIIAEYAVAAAERTQVIFTTHSPDFLTAFRENVPTVTVFDWENGETVLRVLEKDYLEYWLKEYSLGELYRSGELEPVE